VTPARVARAAACALALACAASAAAAQAPDWPSLARVDTIQIVASDHQGTRRERTIWLVVLEGRGYIRAGGTSSWDEGIDVHPDVVARIEGVDYELRAVRIPEGPLYDAVTQAFRDKYGFSDAFLGLIRGIGGSPRIMRLEARPAFR
jgi:hypothetical protein